MTKEEVLFKNGLDAFNDRKFYDAHEHWEEIWLNYKISDAKFIQGLIQLAVSFFHLFNNNIKGARSMIRKCLVKFCEFDSSRGVNVRELILKVKNTQGHIESISQPSDFNDSYIIYIKALDD